MRLADLPIPLIVATCDVGAEYAIVAIGGHPPMRLPPMTAWHLLLAWDPAYRVSWGFDVAGDVRNLRGPRTLSGASMWANIDDDRKAIRALIWYAAARRAADADDAFAASGFQLVEPPSDRADLPELDDPRADTRTTTTEGAAGHAAQYAPPTTKEGPR